MNNIRIVDVYNEADANEPIPAPIQKNNKEAVIGTFVDDGVASEIVHEVASEVVGEHEVSCSIRKPAQVKNNEPPKRQTQKDKINCGKGERRWLSSHKSILTKRLVKV